MCTHVLRPVGYGVAMARRPPRRCSFCGKDDHQVDQLIAGGSVEGTFICDECMAVADDIPTDQVPDTAALAAIGVREFRNQVSAAVRRAAGGERIVITVDGHPMAQLGPLDPDLGGITLQDLAASGLVEPPGSAAHPDPEPAEDLAVDVRLDRIMDELRGR